MAQGQLGLAMLRQSAEGSIKILLYRDKENILSTLLLQINTKIHLKEKYLQYEDDVGVYWSLYFANDSDRDAFIAELKNKCIILTYNSSADAKSSVGVKDVNNTDFAEAPVLLFDEPMEKKDDIKTRMAKVGHQLPMLNINNSSNSDRSEGSLSVSSATATDKESIASVQSTTYQNGGSSTKQPQEIIKHPQVYPKPSVSKESDFVHVSVQPSTFFSNMMMPQNAAAMSFNNFISEQRVQSTENRMNMSKLETKIDRVLDKIDLFKLSGSKSMDLFANEDDRDAEILKLEEKIIELRKENRLLKARATDTESVKQNPLVSDTQVAEIEKLKVENKTKNELIDKLERDLAIRTVKCAAFEQKVIETEKKFSAEAKKVTELDVKAKKCDDLTIRVKELEARLAEEQNKAKASAKNPEDVDSVQLIRGIMNDFYQSFYQAVNKRESFTQQEVLRLAAELIRSETKKALSQN